MTSNTASLQKYKNKKKYKKVLEDIENILKVFDLTKRSLAFYNTYVVVQEITSLIDANTSFLLLQKKKCEDIINDKG